MAAGLVGLLLANEADLVHAQRARTVPAATTAVNPAVLNNQPDEIAVAGSFSDLNHSEHSAVYVGHRQQMILTLQNFTTNQGFSGPVATGKSTYPQSYPAIRAVKRVTMTVRLLT